MSDCCWGPPLRSIALAAGPGQLPDLWLTSLFGIGAVVRGREAVEVCCSHIAMASVDFLLYHCTCCCSWCCCSWGSADFGLFGVYHHPVWVLRQLPDDIIEVSRPYLPGPSQLCSCCASEVHTAAQCW